MYTNKEEQLYEKQRRHLLDKVKRCEESIQQREKAIKLNRAKCAAVEQDTKAIIEYLEFELSKKQLRLEEVHELHERQKEESRQELQEIDEKNAQSLQKLQDELEELTANLSKLEAEHAEILEDLQKQIQSRKHQLAQNKKEHDAKIKEMREEELDPEMVASVLKETAEKVEKSVREDSVSNVSRGRESHQMWREKLEFLKGAAPRISQDRDLLSRQLYNDKQSLLEMETKLEEAKSRKALYKQKVEQLQEWTEKLKEEVQDLTVSLDVSKPRVKIEQKRLGQRIAKITASCEKQNAEVDRLKAAVETERSRTTELRMAMKEADIMFRHIIEEPNMDLQKLRRLHVILESYAPQKKKKL